MSGKSESRNPISSKNPNSVKVDGERHQNKSSGKRNNSSTNSAGGRAGKKSERRQLQQLKEESKRKRQSLSVKLIKFVESEVEVKGFLQKLTRKIFPIRNIRVEGNDVHCVIEFPSAHQLKDAVFAFQAYNKTSKIIKIIARKEHLTRQNSTGSKLSEYLERMTEEASNVLDKHQTLILSTQQRMDDIEQGPNKRKVFQTVDEYTRKKEEIGALQSKLQELQLQKKEFKDFLKCTIDKLEEVRGTQKIDTALRMIYNAFKVECIRLKTALPMYARRTDIISMVTENQVSVLLGETGSGKSTQIAQYMFQAGLSNKGLIACTQPRKIAALSLATHVAQEMGTSVGQLVGYKVGMQIKQSHDTKIIYMTDHMLLNECLKDANFSAYSCIIIDEAHERSIYTDLLLGMIKKCMNNRPDLRVVITSATIDPSVFVEYFGSSCPVLSVAGRMFPVDITWLDDEEAYDNYEHAALEKTIAVHTTEESGDILTFLTSAIEIERCCTTLQERLKGEDNFVCLPLHGRLQPNEQQKVFDPAPKGKRKIVFATNVAETSITIPGIKYVIDTGVAKEMQFDPKRNISTLCVTNVTKSSADQRKGRAGRTEAGKCYRLYSAETYVNMETNSRPEILRVHLGHALLKLMELGVDPLEFNFVQAPPRAMLDAAMETLESVGAVMNKKITDLGKWIAKLPIDPKFGAFVHDAIKDGMGIESMILSACCSAGGSLFYRSGTDEEKTKADKLKVRFCHEGGDLMTMLNVYREWHEQPEKTKGSWCAANSINGKAIRGVRETVNEILTVLQKEIKIKMKFHLNNPADTDNKLQKMLFKTFKNNICHYLGHEKAGYLVVKKDQLVQLFPASALKSLGLLPDWMVIEQVLKTSRDFAINVTIVKKEWIPEAIDEGWLQLYLESIIRQRVEQVAAYEVGEQVFKDFVGVRYTRLREMETNLKESNKGKIVIIEGSKALGEITLYSQRNCKSGMSDVENRISSLRQNMRQEKSEQFLASSNSGVRVVIGAGLSIVDVLMSDEFKTVFVTGVPKLIETMSEEDIIAIFKTFGKIVKIERFKNSKNRNNWGKITFERKEEAELAVTKMKDNFSVGARPSIGFQSTDVRSFRSKIEWCRRPSRGFGFVRFTELDYAVRAQTNSISIGGTIVRVKPSKTALSEVHVGNLNQHVDENVLRQGFEVALGLQLEDIERVTVIRQKVNTSSDTLQTLRQRICRKLEEHVKDGTYELDLRTPKDPDFTFLAFASFSKPEEGLAACAAIDHGLILNNEIVTMKPDLKSSVMIPKVVYSKCMRTVDNLVERLCRTENVAIHQKQLKNENVVLNIHSDNVETMIKVKGDILSVIKGRIMDVESNEDINRLFSWDGKRFIKIVMETTDTSIVADERILSISVHGTDENKEKAIEILVKYLKDLKNGQSKNVALKGEDKPPGVMKELMLLYEFDLNKLKTEAGLKFIDLNHRMHIVTMIGDTKSVEKGSTLVEKLIQSVIEKRKDYNLREPQTRDCVVCFCPIDDGDLKRLEVCGHPYCKDCIELQYKSAVKNNTFPLTCSKEGCEEPWAWKDIINMSVKTSVPVTVLVKKATSSFVTKNKTSYKYCPTADCPVIYRVTEKEKLFSCPECEVRICTACHNQFHDGLTCKMVESMKKDDGGLKLWMKQNAGRAKYCPKCTTPIEKIDGCNHMTCKGCNAHICWVCLAYFNSGSDCYGHMQRVHSSFV